MSLFIPFFKIIYYFTVVIYHPRLQQSKWNKFDSIKGFFNLWVPFFDRFPYVVKLILFHIINIQKLCKTYKKPRKNFIPGGPSKSVRVSNESYVVESVSSLSHSLLIYKLSC